MIAPDQENWIIEGAWKINIDHELYDSHDG
jgi:hypothetical protein